MVTTQYVRCPTQWRPSIPSTAGCPCSLPTSCRRHTCYPRSRGPRHRCLLRRQRTPRASEVWPRPASCGARLRLWSPQRLTGGVEGGCGSNDRQIFCCLFAGVQGASTSRSLSGQSFWFNYEIVLITYMIDRSRKRSQVRAMYGLTFAIYNLFIFFVRYLSVLQTADVYDTLVQKILQTLIMHQSDPR